MSTLLNIRASRVLLLSVAAIMVVSLLAPIAAIANTDLVPGDSAIVSNPGGANLRSDIAMDDATIIAELPAGSTVYVTDGPFFSDAGAWVLVATDGFGPGYVSAGLLQRIGDDELAEANGISDDEAGNETGFATSELAWLEPFDTLVVVDYNLVLSEAGLPILSGTDLDSPILGYVPVGTWLDVTSEREWAGDVPFVRVNFQGYGGYVDGRFIELASEAVADEPEEEVIWIDDPVTEPEPPVETEPDPDVEVTEEAAPDVEVTEEAAPDVEVTEEVAPEVEVTEEVAPEVEVTEEVAPEVEVTEEVAPEVEVTEEATPDAEVTEEATPDVEVTEEAAPEVEVTEEVAPEVEATEEAAPATQRAPIASTANMFDVDNTIGSATVTGTTSGLLCRTEPNPAAPVLMTLAEGTKVLVATEAVNGYLGIDCGGLQGFADVNYLWSGGAADNEIKASKMNVVVTGTGNGLNCRSGAGLNHSVITTVWDGTTLVTRGAATNGWTPVTCGGKNGFVSTTWIEVKPGSGNGSDNGNGSGSGTATVNTGGDGLYCRTGAGTSYGVITVLRHGASVAVRGAQQGEWVPVTCGGSAGFAHASYLNVSAPGPGNTNPAPTPAPTNPNPGAGQPTGSVTVANTGGQGLNCRSGAGTSHGIITTLSLGQSVQTRSGSTSGWTAVICGGANGFVSSEFVTGGGAAPAPTNPTPTPPPAPSPSGMTNGDHGKTTANLNLRYSASMSSSVSVTVNSGLVVLVTGSLTNDFYPVDYDGLVGFMHKDYLVKTNDALSKRGGSGTPGNPAPTPPPTNPGDGNGSPTGSAMVNYAMRYLGYPYVWATRGPASFDCSGFTYWVVLNVTGKNIGSGTWTQVAAGTPVSRSNLQAGDLVFFQNTYTAGLSHVGMYIGNGQFIHAQNEATGVVISDLNSDYYSSRWYSAVRI